MLEIIGGLHTQDLSFEWIWRGALNPAPSALNHLDLVLGSLVAPRVYGCLAATVGM